jgi:hypothetical protein
MKKQFAEYTRKERKHNNEKLPGAVRERILHKTKTIQTIEERERKEGETITLTYSKTNER